MDYAGEKYMISELDKIFIKSIFKSGNTHFLQDWQVKDRSCKYTSYCGLEAIERGVFNL